MVPPDSLASTSSDLPKFYRDNKGGTRGVARFRPICGWLTDGAHLSGTLLFVIHLHIILYSRLWGCSWEVCCKTTNERLFSQFWSRHEAPKKRGQQNVGAHQRSTVKRRTWSRNNRAKNKKSKLERRDFCTDRENYIIMFVQLLFT